VPWPPASLTSGADALVQLAVAKLMPGTTAQLAGCAEGQCAACQWNHCCGLVTAPAMRSAR